MIEINDRVKYIGNRALLKDKEGIVIRGSSVVGMYYVLFGRRERYVSSSEVEVTLKHWAKE